jgi:tRNA (cytidine/uridine-2'-O-)-methyltransferase
MRIALFEPDIPQNTGAILRLAGCLGIGVDVIEPCGFVFDDRRLRRAGMDYLDLVAVRRHVSWPDYLAARGPGRLVLLSTQGPALYHRFRFRADDTLLLGRESVGAPAAVHAAADARVSIPMVEGARSLNVATAAAIVAAEALRQAGALPEPAAAAAPA